MRVEFGRSICGDLAPSERREWLVTNGIGGFASGTIAGSLTRRYHGLLIASLRPPVERTLMVTKIEEVARYGGLTYKLGVNRWKDDYIDPLGYVLVERFFLDGMAPVWHYAFADALIEKRIWMEHGENVSYVRYKVLRAAAPVDLEFTALANYRSFHGNTHAGDWHMNVAGVPQGLRIEPYDGAKTFFIFSDRGEFEVKNVWYRDFVLSIETSRGLDDLDDNLAAGTLSVSLGLGETLAFAAADRDVTGFDAEMALARKAERERALLDAWKTAPGFDDSPPWMRQGILAADQFIVSRPTKDDPKTLSVIAGYPWFADWGRDTMISLPGLTLATGRPDVAKEILRTFALYVDGGMIPNDFPDAGETPQYNSVDAPLWFVEAVARYVEATGDRESLRAIWPALQGIVTSYRDGTRYGIHMDADGLILASCDGLQLTWMDAKVGDWVVTPRAGKPVEIAALWYNALLRMQQLATALDGISAEYGELANRVRTGFDRFWNADAGYLYDVIDGPEGSDPALRPNQLFAVGLRHSPLDVERQRAVVAACCAELLTSNGMRTLSPTDKRFVGHYEGSPRQRDSSYHEGTAWPWLLGAFCCAHARVNGDAATARAFLEPLVDQFYDHGLGSIAEIADGDAPFVPKGSIAQAWSVAELLRAWNDIPSFVEK